MAAVNPAQLPIAQAAVQQYPMAMAEALPMANVQYTPVAVVQSQVLPLSSEPGGSPASFELREFFLKTASVNPRAVDRALFTCDAEDIYSVSGPRRFAARMPFPYPRPKPAHLTPPIRLPYPPPSAGPVPSLPPPARSRPVIAPCPPHCAPLLQISARSLRTTRSYPSSLA